MGRGRQNASTSQFLVNYGTRLLTTLVGLAGGVVIARGLGPAGRGDFAAASTVTALAVQLANFGLSAAILYAVARRPRRAGAVLRLAWVGAAGLLGVAIAGSVIGVIAARIPVASLLVGFWVPVQFLALQQEQVLLATRRYAAYNAAVLGVRVLVLAGMVAAFATRPGQLWWFLAAQIGAEAFTVLVVRGWLGWGASRRRSAAERRWLAPFLRVAFRAAPTLLLPFLLIRFDLLIVKFLGGADQAGFYAVAGQFVDLMLILPASMAAVLFPELARAANPGLATLRAANTVTWLLLGLVALLVVGGYKGVAVLFGQSFSPSYVLLLIRLPGAVALGIESVLVQYFASEGYPRFLSAYWASAVGASVAANLWLVPAYGATGAAVASSASYALVASLVGYQFFKQTGLAPRRLFSLPLRDTVSS